MIVDDRFDFSAKCVIITGAASGMGLFAAQAFAARGAAVVMTDVNEDKVKSAADEIVRSGGRAIGLKVDVRLYDDIAMAAEKAIEEFGSIDITVSFAGGEPGRMLQKSRDFKTQPVEVIDWGLDVNGRAPVYMARAVINQMIAQKSGVIINIGSIDGVTGGALVYSAAKSALIGFTKSLAIYGAPHNIRSCCISPGPVLTRPEMANMKTLLGRAAEPDEIINMLLFLASDKAAFITGVNYLVDGGRACGAMN